MCISDITFLGYLFVIYRCFLFCTFKRCNSNIKYAYGFSSSGIPPALYSEKASEESPEN